MNYRIGQIGNTTEFVSQRHIDIQCGSHINFTMEIVYVTEGLLEMGIGEKTYTVSPGEMIFVLPFEIHSFHTPEHSKCHILMFSRELIKECYEAVSSAVDIRVFAISDELVSFLDSRIPKDENILDDMHAGCILLPICLEIIDKIPHTENGNSDGDLFIRALTLINEKYRDPLNETEIAAMLNVHPVTLSRIFSKNARMTFNTYRNLLKIDFASRRFKDAPGLTVGEVALDAGFESIRTFNRVFLKYMNCTPLEYKKKISSEKKKISYSPSPEIFVK